MGALSEFGEDEYPFPRKVPFLCRLLGHRWKPSHRVEKIQPYGLLGWVYTDDVCTRCWITEYRMTAGDSQQDVYPIQPQKYAPTVRPNE